MAATLNPSNSAAMSTSRVDRSAREQRIDASGDAALSRHDDDRATALDREPAALLHELRAATGLGGRRRRLGDESERARKTVSARVRDVPRHLDELHPELALHLRQALAMGTSCCISRASPCGGSHNLSARSANHALYSEQGF
jgi:hypothetical protein